MFYIVFKDNWYNIEYSIDTIVIWRAFSLPIKIVSKDFFFSKIIFYHLWIIFLFFCIRLPYFQRILVCAPTNQRMVALSRGKSPYLYCNWLILDQKSNLIFHCTYTHAASSLSLIDDINNVVIYPGKFVIVIYNYH